VIASQLGRLLVAASRWIGITLLTLALVDVLCISLGLFPPTLEYGDSDVGWLPLIPGKIVLDSCVDASRRWIYYYRNEIGVRTARTMAELTRDRSAFMIAAIGDSQSDICAPNELNHPGVLEAGLNAGGVHSVVLPYGVGRYSPLQAYLLYETRLKQYHPDALLVNLYTGNDFNDLLRIDDRPFFVRSGRGYEIHKPVWYRYDDPNSSNRSRVLFLLRSILTKTGLRNRYQRVSFLWQMAAVEGKGVGTVFAYMRDLRRSIEPSVGYQEAFTAQMLNQQLFFHHFPKSKAESVRRTRALMEMITKRNPGVLLIMSPLPSYQLARGAAVDESYRRALGRLPLTLEEGVREEEELYYILRDLAAELGWLFIDNLEPLRRYHGPAKLYNDFDYHLTPTASAIIGDVEAEALILAIKKRRVN
jgi:hypothetical protein